MDPQKPKHITKYAEACLEALATQGFGKFLSLGGALGLSYYLDYRPTHDVDAWWLPSAREDDRRKVVALLEETLSRNGTVRIRSWGDVISVELVIGQKVVFSFQIASRSAQLEDPQAAPWPPGMLMDSFRELLAAKMVALVERGAPRDFRDVYEVCQAGLAQPGICWSLWRQRRELAGDDSPPARARLAVLTHLQRIELHRPLQSIPDTAERARAEQLRAWFRGEFLNGLVD
jgi:hypothetical protein